MQKIANFLFETRMLKQIPRSGYQFLGAGRETIAEHSFFTAVIGFVMTKMEPEVDSLRLISMCLVHDLSESRTGDLNKVQKKYLIADEDKAVDDMTEDLFFGTAIKDLLSEFNEGATREAKLARDADQLSFLMDLKANADLETASSPLKWLPIVLKRIKTATGEKIAEAIQNTSWDGWWFENFVDG